MNEYEVFGILLLAWSSGLATGLAVWLETRERG